MRQFLTSNIWSRGMMPATLFKEQVFNMCEKLASACVWNEVIVRFREEYPNSHDIANLSEKIHSISKNILKELGESDEYDKEKAAYLPYIAMDKLDISISTSNILHKLYLRKFDWKSWDLGKLTTYYQIVVDGFNELKTVLGEDLNYPLIRSGVVQIISNMKTVQEHRNTENSTLQNHVVLLYPFGLVNSNSYDNPQPEKNFLFWAIKRLNPPKNGRDCIKEVTCSYRNLAMEILVEYFFDSGAYQYNCGYVSLKDENPTQDNNFTKNNDNAKHGEEVGEEDDLTVAEDVLNYYDDFADYNGIPEKKFSLSKATKKALDRIDKTFDVIIENIEELWGLRMRNEGSNNPKEILIVLRLMYKYMHFRKSEGGATTGKSIFHVLKFPSYENSLTGLLDQSARNADILFSLKSDLLQYILADEELKKSAIQIEEGISRVYLDYNARIDGIKDIFHIEGIRAGSFHDLETFIAVQLSEKKRILDCLQEEVHDMYNGMIDYPREKNLLVFIYLKICESEYTGILRDMDLLYQNMESWIIKLPDTSIELLLNRQCEIESDSTSANNAFDFEDNLKEHSRSIAAILDPDDIEKSSKDIRRYANRCFCIWQSVLDWYPLSDWGKNNNAYADFGTMVALVQLERQLRKGKISMSYLSAYKGDSGKKITIRFRDDLPETKMAVEIIMNLLFFQLLSNFGFRESIQIALSILRLYVRQYKEILRADSIAELDEHRQDYADDARLPQEDSIGRNVGRAKNAARELYIEEIDQIKASNLD